MKSYLKSYLIVFLSPYDLGASPLNEFLLDESTSQKIEAVLKKLIGARESSRIKRAPKENVIDQYLENYFEPSSNREEILKDIEEAKRSSAVKGNIKNAIMFTGMIVRSYETIHLFLDLILSSLGGSMGHIIQSIKSNYKKNNLDKFLVFRDLFFSNKRICIPVIRFLINNSFGLKKAKEKPVVTFSSSQKEASSFLYSQRKSPLLTSHEGNFCSKGIDSLCPATLFQRYNSFYTEAELYEELDLITESLLQKRENTLQDNNPLPKEFKFQYPIK